MVDDHMELSNCELFACYAGDDPDKWKLIIGQDVVHDKYGSGSIINVYQTEDYEIRLEIRFEAETEIKKFPAEAYSWRFVECSLPSTLVIDELIVKQCKERKIERERRRKAREERAKQQQRFVELKRKFSAMHPSNDPFSPLYPILEQLDRGHPLDEEDEQWLKDSKEFGVLATYHGMCHRKKMSCDDRWHEVRASSYWRKAGQPSKALKITEGVRYPNNPRRTAAVLTTRGGALADLDRLEEAERCAWEAIKLNPTSYHPYRLLGSIYAKKGEYEEADQYFMRAQELGAPPKELEDVARRSMPEWYSHYLRGRAYALNRQSRMAAEYFDKAFTLAERLGDGVTAKKILKRCLHYLEKRYRIVVSEIAKYLLEKDNVKYHWVQRYL